MRKIFFVCINGYEMPYSRVRGYHFAQALRKLGVETAVLSFRDHLGPKWGPVEMLELGDRQKLWLNVRAFWRLAKQKNAVLYLQKVHYHAAAPFILSRLGKNRLILDYDDWDIDRSPFFRRPGLNRLFFGATDPARITGRVARDALGCIASSSYLYDYLNGYNDRVFHIPTGVDTACFRPAAPWTGPVTFVWTGQVWGEVIYQNIRFILECFSEAARETPGARLQIIGGGQWMPRVRQDIKDLGLGRDVGILDWVAPQDMPRHLASASVGLLPLISDEQNALWMRSKSPTKLFEYMAMGLPTVATAMGEACQVIEDGRDGFLAPDRARFIEAMKMLARDGQMRARMGRSARAKAEERYSLDVLGRKLLDAILAMENR